MCLLSGCKMFFNNSVDPDSENYQGYLTVDDVEDIKSEDTSGNYDFPPILKVTELKGASEYKWQYSQSKDYIYSSSYFYSYDNSYEIEKNLSPGKWYWRVKVMDSDSYGEWSEMQEFSINSYKITYHEKDYSLNYYIFKSTVEYSREQDVDFIDNQYDFKTNINGYDWDFAGWNTQPDGSGEDYYSWSSFNMVNRDLDLYAQYRNNGFVK